MVELQESEPITLGKLIRHARLATNMSQIELRSRLHMPSYQLVSLWECGYHFPNSRNLSLLTEILGVEPSYWEQASDLHPWTKKWLMERREKPAQQQNSKSKTNQERRQRDREAQIASMLNKGMTLQETGERFGITRERVRQIRERMRQEGVKIACLPKDNAALRRIPSRFTLLRLLRILCELDIKQIDERTGVGCANITNMERGRCRMSAKRRQTLADFYGMPPSLVADESGWPRIVYLGDVIGAVVSMMASTPQEEAFLKEWHLLTPTKEATP